MFIWWLSRSLYRKVRLKKIPEFFLYYLYNIIKARQNYGSNLYDYYLVHWGQLGLYIFCSQYYAQCLMIMISIFQFRYKREFGFIIDNREIIVDDIRVRGIGKSVIKEEETIAECEGNPEPETVSTVS